MSAPFFKADILFAQRLWASAGLYNAALDGLWGPKTQAASDAFDAAFVKCRSEIGVFDVRSEAAIYTLLPKAQVCARQFMVMAGIMPFGVKMLSGTRTYAEQNDLYAKGRTAGGAVVTNARGGQSNHNFGIAWDVGIFVEGVYYTGINKRQNDAYAALAAKMKTSTFETPLEWGGDWMTIKDAPHYQLKTGKSVSQCNALLMKGEAYV